MLDCRTSTYCTVEQLQPSLFSIKDRERKNKCCALVVDFHDFLVWDIVQPASSMLPRYAIQLIVSVFAYTQAFDLCCPELVKSKHEQYADL